MMSLKPTSLITAVIVITLIVLSIIDLVFSNDEVKRCSRFIDQLYRYRVIRVDQQSMEEILPMLTEYYATGTTTEIFGSTLDDEAIGNDRFKMFKKGFLVFNEADIHKINNQFLDRFEGSADIEELKKMVREMTGGPYTLPHLERYVKEAEELTDPFELRLLIRRLRGQLSSGYHRPSRFEVRRLVKEMDEYTFAYFKEFLNKVSITGKESLKNPADFCTDWLPGKNKDAAVCTKIIKKKFKLNDTISGSEIFDLFYEHWSDHQLKLVYKMKEEIIEMREDIAQTPQDELEDARKYYNKLNKLYMASLKHFYKQFEDILDRADVSDMPTSKQFCENYIDNAASTISAEENIEIPDNF